MLKVVMIDADVPPSHELKDDVAFSLKLNAALQELYSLCPNARIREFHVSTPREGNT